MTEKQKIDMVVMSKEKKFWSDVVEARRHELAVSENNITYLKAVLEMAEKKLKEIKE